MAAQIYLKREDLLHTGAHKINNAVGQALLARRMGKRRVIAETGAGQHGVATATVCALFGLRCVIYMGAEDVQRQALNVFRMRLLGAEVVTVNAGTRTLKGCDQRGVARLGNERARYLLSARQRTRSTSVPAHGARISKRHWTRSARTDFVCGGQAPARTGCLRRRRFECDRSVSSLYCRRRSPVGRRRSRRTGRFVRRTRCEISQRNT